MPDTGAPYALPYPPAAGVAPDVPYDMQQLAEQLEEILSTRLPGALYLAQTTVNIPVSGAVGAGNTAAVSFPAGRFSATPRVLVSQASLPAGSGLVIVKHSAASASGVTVSAWNAATTPSALAIVVDVLAIGPVGA